MYHDRRDTHKTLRLGASDPLVAPLLLAQGVLSSSHGCGAFFDDGPLDTPKPCDAHIANNTCCGRYLAATVSSRWTAPSSPPPTPALERPYQSKQMLHGPGCTQPSHIRQPSSFVELDQIFALLTFEHREHSQSPYFRSRASSNSSLSSSNNSQRHHRRGGFPTGSGMGCALSLPHLDCSTFLNSQGRSNRHIGTLSPGQNSLS